LPDRQGPSADEICPQSSMPGTPTRRLRRHRSSPTRNGTVARQASLAQAPARAGPSSTDSGSIWVTSRLNCASAALGKSSATTIAMRASMAGCALDWTPHDVIGRSLRPH
jgi:hypothetical protein